MVRLHGEIADILTELSRRKTMIPPRELSVFPPNPLGLGGKTALLERTKAFIFSLTLGPKVWYNESIRLADMLSVAARLRVCLPLRRG